MTRYDIKIVQVLRCADSIEVEAATREEAIELAKEVFQFDWEMTKVVATDAVEVEEVKEPK